MASESVRSHDFLSGGGGEMGARIRSFDWSRTAIGRPESWSPALRTMVRVLLANRFPLLLWWGPEYVSIYNDAYCPILGRKHPWGLGQPVRECWSEIWDILKPLIDTPFNGGPATWIEDIELQINRAGFSEETHFTVAYSPVPDETANGGIGGVLATVHEITEKVIGERRGAILRELGSRGAEAKTAEQACATAAETLAKYAKDVPFALLYLTGSDGRNATLAASCGVENVRDMAPSVIELGESKSDRTWPLAAAQRTEEMQFVTNLGSVFAVLPPGTWPVPPHTAAIVPIRSNIAHKLAGFLVAGLSSHLKLDEAYINFLDLAASQIATAVANARAYETERRRAEALAEIDRAKTAFFSNVSHEFRTPLTLMLGPLESVLAKDDAVAPEDREQLQTVHRNSLRLLKLVNSLLDFSRIEAGRVKAYYAPVDLAVLTTDLASNFRSTMQAAGLELVVDCAPLKEPVFVDREMWEKIVLNLLSNAFKFTLEGRVSVTLQSGKSGAILTVSDTGVGIPHSELPHIFERFHRVEGAKGRTYEGTGIGLALIQELVKLHGGTVEATSRLGEGSSFTVMIPFGSAHLPQERLGMAAANQVSTAVRAEVFTGEAGMWIARERLAHPSQEISAETPAGIESGRRPRIVVADDNADMREYICHILGPHYDLVAVSDGRAALEEARRTPPDLILSDVMMPGLDGFGLLRELRVETRLREIPIVLLSARAGEEARTEGIAAGADDYLTKPFSGRELSARVQTTLDLQRVRREAREQVESISAQFETLLNQAPFGVCLVDADFRIRQINPTARAAFGDIPDLVGRDFDEVIHIVWPKIYADEVVRLFRHTLETGEPSVTHEHIEQRLDRGVKEYYEWRVDRIPLPEGRFGVVCYFRDISTQVQAREAVEALNAQLTFDLSAMTRMQQLSTRLVQAGELNALLGEIIDAAIEITRADKGNIQLLQNDTLQIAHQRGFEAPFLDFYDSASPGQGACGTALERRERVIVEDVTTSPIFVGTAALDVMLAAGVRAVQSTPLVSRSGRVLGMLSTHYSSPQCPAERDLRMLDLLARQAADLIERRLSEEALRLSEERLASLVTGLTRLHELSGKLSAITDERAGLQAILESNVELHGTDRGLLFLHDGAGEMLYDGASVRFDDRALEQIVRIAPQSGASGTAFRENRRVVIEDTETDPMFEPFRDAARSFGFRAVHSTPIHDRAGECLGVLSVHFGSPRRPTELEIQFAEMHARLAGSFIERVRATQTLRESEIRYHRLFDYGRSVMNNMAEGLYTVDTNGLVTFVNPAAETMFGWTSAELMGKKMHDVIHYKRPDGTPFPASECAGLEVLETGIHLRDHGDVFIRKDGSFFPVVVSAAPLVTDGKTSGIVVAFRDDTERRKAETALRESEMRFRAMANQAPVLIWISGVDKLLTWFNGPWLKFTGRTLEQEVGNGWTENVHPDDCQRFVDTFVEAFDARRQFTMEYRLRRHDGDWRWVLQHGLPLQMNDVFTGFIGSCIDITGMKRAEEELRSANRDLEQFAHSASHDLQEPLRSIRIYSELLDQRCRDKLDDKALQFLEYLRNGAIRMETLIRDILTYTEAARLDKPVEATNSCESLQAALASLAGAISECSASVTFEQLPTIQVHGAHLQQLFQNLIGNAIKYRRAGIPPIVHVTAVQQYGIWHFSVTDNGIGIEPQYQERIFGLFKRLHSRDQYSGSGIGLAICQRIVERYYGRIWVESEPGRGSTFIFTLPV